MANNTFNTGRDVTVVYMVGGVRFDMSHVVAWDAKPVIKSIKVNPLNSPPIQKDLPEGWTFTFTIDRNGPAADSLQALKETAYWNGLAAVSEAMYAYISEPDGSVTTWAFEDCTSHLEDAGSWSQEKAVSQKVTGFSARRRQVA